MKKLLLIFIGIVGLYIFFSFHLYSSGTIEGWVIDMDTSKPLEGVEIHIYWNVYTGGLEGNFSVSVKEFR